MPHAYYPVGRPGPAGHASEPPADLIPLNEAAKLFPRARPGRKVSIATLHRWILDGRIRGWCQGRVVFVSRREARAFARLHLLRRPGRVAEALAANGKAPREAEVVLDQAGASG